MRLGRAATAGGDQVEGHDDSVEQLLEEVPADVHQQRSKIMFSGETGAVVASGDGKVTNAPSRGLCRDVITTVDALPSELFDKHAKQRPCGLLDHRGAYGMLLGDLLGLPLLPWALAEPLGKAMVKLKDGITEKKKQARKKAKRQGKDPEDAAERVLRRAVELKLPSPAEIKAAWRRIAQAARPPPHQPAPPQQPPPLPPPITTITTDPPVDFFQKYLDAGDFTYAFFSPKLHPEIPGYRGRPGGAGGDPDERFWNPAKPPCVPSDHRPAHLFNSREAAEAAGMAARVERLEPPADGDYEYYCEEEAYEVACVKHKHAMRRLREAFPEISREESHRRPCPCGRGSLAIWPWVVQTAQQGFCECDMASWELTCWRSDWIAAGYPSLAW